jgi:hypothetical protein
MEPLANVRKASTIRSVEHLVAVAPREPIEKILRVRVDPEGENEAFVVPAKRIPCPLRRGEKR